MASATGGGTGALGNMAFKKCHLIAIIGGMSFVINVFQETVNGPTNFKSLTKQLKYNLC